MNQWPDSVLAKGSGASTSSGNGTDFLIPKQWTGPLYVLNRITAVSGTNPTLDLSVQVKMQGSYLEVPCEWRMITGTARETRELGERFMLESADATGIWLAKYAPMPAQTIRHRREIGGTDTPTFTYDSYWYATIVPGAFSTA